MFQGRISKYVYFELLSDYVHDVDILFTVEIIIIPWRGGGNQILI